jgi:pumilio RNA-binding family
VISKIRGNLIQLAQHKFASNVCEQALIYADADTRLLLINEIMTPQPDGQSPVLIMVKDQYASKCIYLIMFNFHMNYLFF